MIDEPQILTDLLEKALELGASVAGYVPAENLRDCPSALAAGPQGFQTFSGTIVVLGLYHDPQKPKMDWWVEGKGTPGDRMLRRINRGLKVWLRENHGISAQDIPYQIYDGGIYLKDAAVLAGLGYIGRNNLVITPEFGPRVRFRALWVDIDSEQPVRHTPEIQCDECDHPCETQCPQKALEAGRFSRTRCMIRMNTDRAANARNVDENGEKRLVDHCRTCELVCPAYREP
jgi:epoxyqueuosine reductase